MPIDIEMPTPTNSTEQPEDELQVAEQLLDGDEDEKWKKLVRAAFKKADPDNKFEEVEEPDFPNQLIFRDKEKPENTVAFADPCHARVAGEQEAFNALVATAKELGKTAVNFGSFEQHPEYRAKLYLACLQQGMKMNNAPDLASLKEYPEYAEIAKIHQQEKALSLRQDFQNLNQELEAVKKAFQDNPECQKLLKDFNEAKKAKDYDKLDQVKAQIIATPEGGKLKDLTEQKAQLLKDGVASGVFRQEKIDQISKHKTEYSFIQREGESDADFAARKDKAESYKPDSEKRFSRNLNKAIFKQAATRKTRQ